MAIKFTEIKEDKQPSKVSFTPIDNMQPNDQQSQQNTNLPKEIGQYALGAYSGAMDPVFGAGTKIDQLLNKIPGVNIPLPQKRELSQSSAYQAGKPLGQMASYAGTVELGGLAGAAPAMANILAGAGYGASMSPDSLKGAISGASLGALGEALPGVMSKIGSLAKKFKPQKLTDEIMDNLSSGKNVTENAESLIQDIKNAGTIHRDTYESMLKPVKEGMGDYSIYNTKHGFVPHTYKRASDELHAGEVGGFGLLDAKKFHNDFIANPTFDHAHELQSQLGDEERGTKGYDMASRQAKINFKNLRKSLKNDIYNSLNKQDISGSLANKYKNASDYYLKNYVPYKDIPAISKVMNNKGVTSDEVLNVFKNPKIQPKPIDDSLNSEKIANDLGQSGKNKILFSALGKKGSLKPEELLDKVKNLEDTTGFSRYMPEGINQQVSQLHNRVTLRNLLQGGAGAIAGGMVGSKLGIPWWVDMPVAGAAVYKHMPKITESIMPKAQGALSSVMSQIPSGARTAMREVSPDSGQLYSMLKKASIAKILGGNR